MRFAHKLHAFLETCEEIVLAGAMIGAMLALLLQVVSRYVLGLPLAWTEELARYCFVWAVFIGASQVMRYREHIAITILTDTMPRRVQQILALWMNLLMIIFLCVLVWQGWVVSAKVVALSSIALDVSMAAVYIPLPIAAAVMIVRLLFQSWEVARTGPRHGIGSAL